MVNFPGSLHTKAQEKEREKIGENIHREIGALSMVKTILLDVKDSTLIKTNKLNQLDTSIMILDETYSNLRDKSHDLYPIILIKSGFKKALEELVKKYSINPPIVFDLNINMDFSKIQDETKLILYRIFQEIFNNIISHSNTKKVDIKFDYQDSLIIEITDYGKGFDISKIKESPGMGWKVIESKVIALNGTLKIDSAIGKGCRIKIILNEPL